MVSGDGLSTTVQPAANAGAILNIESTAGKFHGAMAATTPTGSRRTTVVPGIGRLSLRSSTGSVSIRSA